MTELAFYVERDRANLASRRATNEVFRTGRLMLGARLAERRRGMTDQAFGRVLRALGLNRHTAHHAMKLAAEFSRADGSLDLEKLAAARRRGAGVLGMTRAGQRVLEAEPGQLSIEDLKRIARTDATKCVDAHQHLSSGKERVGDRTDATKCVDARQHMSSGKERVGGQRDSETARQRGSEAARHPGSETAKQRDSETGIEAPSALNPCLSSVLSVPSVVNMPCSAFSSPDTVGPAGAGGGPQSPVAGPAGWPSERTPPGRAAPRGGGKGGAAGVQMVIDFDGASARVASRMGRISQRITLGLLRGDDARVAEITDLLERLDRLALSLLHGAPA